MTSPNDDMLAKRLAELPEARLAPHVRAAIHRRARAALAETRSGKLVRLWSSVMLPAVLVGCAVVYAVDAAQFLQQTYVTTASR